MPTQIPRGRTDKIVKSIRDRLDQYLAAHPAAGAALYRQNAASVRIRIIDPAFGPMSLVDRHNTVWQFLADGLPEDTLSDISVLLLLTPDDTARSLMNLEFDDPIPSRL